MTTEAPTPAVFAIGPVTQTPDIAALAKALVVFQDKVRSVKKGKTARVEKDGRLLYTYQYADLGDVIEDTREARTAAELAVVQQPVSDGRSLSVVTTVVHASGQWMRSSISSPHPTGKPQELGSLITYLRRYSYSAALGICTELDDDGNAAQGNDAKIAGRGASPKGEAGGKPAPAPRANSVTHTGKLATREQVDQLLDLRRQVGGLTVCDVGKACPYPNGTSCGYHKQLGAFKDASGNSVRDADKLASEQIENLIGRYKAKIAQQGARAAEQPDVGAIGGVSPGTVQTLRGHLAKKTQTEEEFQFAEKELCAVFGVDSIAELNESQSGSALALVLAFQTDKWGDVLARVREKEAG